MSFNVKADSGFDSSWDSDSSSSYDYDYDYGSSWGSSRDNDYSSSYNNESGSSGSGQSSDPNKVGFYIFIVVLVIVIIGFAIMSVEYSNLSPDNNSNDDNDDILSPMDIRAILGDKFDIDGFYKNAFQIYYDVQIAWMDNDIERVRSILSDEMFNTYKMQLETLKVKNQKNMMEDINLVNVYITNIRKENNKEVIDVIMNVTCRDYLIDINTSSVLRGNRNKVWHYEYKLSYMRTEKENKIKYCPNCGAELNKGSSVKCSYCGAIINRETDKFILIDKKMLNQR